MFSFLMHVRSWYSTPWKSPAVLAAEQRLASLKTQVKENRQRITETENLRKDFSPFFKQMQESYGYFLQLLQPPQGTSQPPKPKDVQSDFIQRVKQMKIVVAIIIATHESENTHASGPLSILGTLLEKAQRDLHKKKLSLAKLRGRLLGFQGLLEWSDQFISNTRRAHAELRNETLEVRRMGTPPPKCRSGSGIGIQSQP